MPKPARGELRFRNGGRIAVVTIEGRTRKSYDLPTCKTEDEARTRSILLAEQARWLRKAGHIGSAASGVLLDELGEARQGSVAEVLQAIGMLVGGQVRPVEPVSKSPTFAEVAKRWTSGELHKLYPDHVKDKDSDLDEARLERLEVIDVAGRKLGDVPIDQFCLEHAEAVMRSLPSSAKTTGTRRHYAQLLHRVLTLAVYPLHLIQVSPLPRGFLPKPSKPPARRSCTRARRPSSWPVPPSRFSGACSMACWPEKE